MKYEGVIIRPPSESESILLQVTVGCSHNRCTFCPAYKGVKFRIRSFSEIEEDIILEAEDVHARRVFLCDGDALIIPQPRLLEILACIQRHLHGIERVGTYANAKSLIKKSPVDLAALHALGLNIVYMGVETGNAGILQMINKGANTARIIEAGRRIKEAGIKLSVTILLGIGGKERSLEHALDTARVLNEIDPDYIGALTLMLVPGTPLYDDYVHGRFIPPDAFGYLSELAMIVNKTSLTNCFFASNHASNYLPIRAHLPFDKEKTVKSIEHILEMKHQGNLRPEYLRAL
jgi:radical SAM superfamily enzyme YgiQ (UPF0313 family)